VLFAYTENSRIENVTASNNWCGIHLDDSSDNALASNTVSNNDNGICLYSSSNNALESNTASNSDNGICLYSSSNNNLIYNNYLNNTANAYDCGNNQWDSGTVGNYWSDYREKYPDAEELNESEIWDTPYDIPGSAGAQDRFPLMQPWTATSLKGDLNSDGYITPADAAIALRIAATGAQNPAADMNDDGTVTSLDALMILQAAAGNIEL